MPKLNENLHKYHILAQSQMYDMYPAPAIHCIKYEQNWPREHDVKIKPKTSIIALWPYVAIEASNKLP